MSTIALNRTYELRLPQSFVEIDREEMEYVDGGWTFNASECNKIASNFAIAAGVATIIGGITTLLVAVLSMGNWLATAIAGCITVVVAGGLGTISGIFWRGSCGNGLSITRSGIKYL